MNWFSKHIPETTRNTFIKFPKSAGSSTTEDSYLSFESSVDESENEHLKSINIENITFRKSYRKTRNVSKDDREKASKKVQFSKCDGHKSIFSDKSSNIFEFPDISTFDEANELSKMEQFSKESGIVTLPDSTNDESNFFCDKEISTAREQTDLMKPQEISSDYMTCSSNSLFEKNIFEITEDISSLLAVDESKDVKGLAVDKSNDNDSNSNDISFISISEVYKYVDKDEGIVLYERRLLKTPR